MHSCPAVVTSICASTVTTGTPLIIKGNLIAAPGPASPRGMHDRARGTEWSLRKEAAAGQVPGAA
jgi:hypothetical protein